MNTILAWHFVGDSLRDGRPVPADGELLTEKEAILCGIGLHASIDAFDALQYAPGDVLCRVKLGGKIVHGRDKVVATERTIVARIDATELLRSFTRKQALKVKHLWNMPAVVEQYLLTGDESLRSSAYVDAYVASTLRHVLSDVELAAVTAAVSATCCLAEGFASRAAAYAASDTAYAAASAAAARHNLYPVASAALHTAARNAAQQEFNQMVAEAFAAIGVE